MTIRLPISLRLLTTIRIASDDEFDQPPDTVASCLAPATLSYLPSSANIFPDVSSRAHLTVGTLRQVSSYSNLIIVT